MKVIESVNKGNKGTYLFNCPGCGCIHQIPTIKSKAHKIIWQFNGNLESPTFTPSMKAFGQTYTCHFNLTNGIMKFHSDCSDIKNKGKLIPLPDIIPEEWVGY